MSHELLYYFDLLTVVRIAEGLDSISCSKYFAELLKY